MANSRWADIKANHPDPSPAELAEINRDYDLGQLVYDLRTEAGLTQTQLAERMGTTQSVVSRLEEGGGASNRLDTVRRLADAFGLYATLSLSPEPPGRVPVGEIAPYSVLLNQPTKKYA